MGGVEAAMTALSSIKPETPAVEPAAPLTPVAEPAPEAPAATEVAPDPSAAPAPAEVPPADDFTQKVDAAIARQVRQQQELAEAKARADAAEGRAAKTDALLEKARNGNVQGIVELMRETGWDADAFVTALMANDPKKPEVVRQNQLERELAETRARLAEIESSVTQRDQARQIEAFKANVIPTLESKKAEYSHLLGMFEAPEIQDAVVQEVVRLHQASGGVKRPTVHEAAASLEAQLRARVKRVQGLVSSAQVVVDTPKPNPAPKSAPPAPKTLTNDLTASPDAVPEAETDEDRYKLAADILRKSNLGFN